MVSTASIFRWIAILWSGNTSKNHDRRAVPYKNHHESGSNKGHFFLASLLIFFALHVNFLIWIHRVACYLNKKLNSFRPVWFELILLKKWGPEWKTPNQDNITIIMFSISELVRKSVFFTDLGLFEKNGVPTGKLRIRIILL